ncbi:hypothetical protein [Pallidibacillus pasinlerensis]|uniref:Uncharacterized protein n=1 Tax=Pallidibacillus pasinlerensis TaxID=2703818 RepID=A0ABX0AAD6_9BACI|nr:hypothetical protein [Pallidibacillus pasinlerensis]NCU18158.1 hypothetical protein [Pallidibacillus pasinlerensis]
MRLGIGFDSGQNVLRVMKDKRLRKMVRIVLHRTYEGQIIAKNGANCPSSRL